MLCFPAASRTSALDIFTSGLNAWIHLYRTDTPISADTVLGDFLELDVTGYAPLPVRWWTPAVLQGVYAKTWGENRYFQRGAGGFVREVWGYYITQGETGQLLWAERGPDPPYPMAVAGDNLFVWPALTWPAPPGGVC